MASVFKRKYKDVRAEPISLDDESNVFSGISIKSEPCERITENSQFDELGAQNELIINLLQGLCEKHDAHDASAATKEGVRIEGKLSRAHTEEQITKMRATLLELNEYLDNYSAKRQLTIYSLVLLGVSIILFGITYFFRPVIIDSAFAMISILVSLGFLLMARFAPEIKK